MTPKLQCGHIRETFHVVSSHPHAETYTLCNGCTQYYIVTSGIYIHGIRRDDIEYRHGPADMLVNPFNHEPFKCQWPTLVIPTYNVTPKHVSKRTVYNPQTFNIWDTFTHMLDNFIVERVTHGSL